MALKGKELLLVLVMEECAEVAQRASKSIRFTDSEVQLDGDNSLNNSERMLSEFNDLVAVISMLYNKHISYLIDEDLVAKKKEKIKKWMEYSRKQKTLE